MKTAVVTGATGFIGNALTQYLLQKSIKVYALGRNEKKLSDLARLGAIPVCIDLAENDNLAARIHDKIDVFFHCAFSGGFESKALKDYDLQLNNARYACDSVAGALKLGVQKFVLASTINIVEAKELLFNESFFPRYTCIYSAGKLVAEMIGKTLAKNGGMEFCTALIAMPYGENNFAATLPNIIIRQLNEGISPKLITGDNLYDLIYIEDVASALYHVGELGKDYRSYYIGHRELITFRSWMEQIRDIVSPQTELQFGVYPDAPSLDYTKIDLDALYRDTGFEATANFEETIRCTAEWVKQLGWEAP